MSTLESIAVNIIKEQSRIIGPLAVSEAKKISGLEVGGDREITNVHITASDPKTAIDSLVSQYERLFGRASHEVCKEAAASLIGGLQPSDIPASLAA